MGEQSPIRQIGILPLMILPMMKGHLVSIKTLQNMMEFDCAVRVGRDGTLTAMPGMMVPEVINSDGELSATPDMPWEAMNGYTGQYSYRGPVMHPSEYIGGRLARDILSTPGIYVCLVVEADCDDAWFVDCESHSGWIVATIPDEGQWENVVCHDVWCPLIGCPSSSTTD